MTRVQKFALLSCLYIAQGLPFGFFTQSLPTLLRNQGMSLEVIGFSSVLALPWAFKFLWAPILDIWGMRKVWILVMNLLAVSTILLLSNLSLQVLANDAFVLFAGFFLLNLFSATQDIAADGIAVNQLEEDERGFGNGIQVAGYRVGMILGGGLLLAWFSQIGWQYSLWILALLLLFTTLPVFFFQEKAYHAKEEKLRFQDFVAFIKIPGMGIWSLVVITYKFGEHFGGAMIRPLLVDEGLGIEDIALVLGSVGFATGLLGALVGGWSVAILGRYKALFGFGILQALAIAAWALIPMGFTSITMLYALSALEHFTGGLATSVLFTIMMDHCRKEYAGSDYTIQACLVVLMNMLAAILSGVSANSFGYEFHFLLAGGLGVVSLPLIFCYRNRLLGTKEMID
ncbi:MAG: MFS transporter [Spirochaetota bacterium]